VLRISGRRSVLVLFFQMTISHWPNRGQVWKCHSLLSLILLVAMFKKANDEGRRAIYTLYLENTRFINNWDLVDCSAEHIVGAQLRGGDKRPLYDLAVSDMLWERRISIMSTFGFIKHGEFADTLKIAEILLVDKEDLIHKAVGWMLREIGKRNIQTEEKFLKKYCRQMPRTMLRRTGGSH